MPPDSTTELPGDWKRCPQGRSLRDMSAPGGFRSSGHETAALKVAVRARPYGRPTGTGAFTENAVGRPFVDDELRARAYSVAAPATCPDVLRAHIGRCRLRAVLHFVYRVEEGEVRAGRQARRA